MKTKANTIYKIIPLNDQKNSTFLNSITTHHTEIHNSFPLSHITDRSRIKPLVNFPQLIFSFTPHHLRQHKLTY